MSASGTSSSSPSTVPVGALTREEALEEITRVCLRVTESTVAEMPEDAEGAAWWPPPRGEGAVLVRTRHLEGRAADPDDAAHMAALCAWWNDADAAPWMDAGTGGTAYTPEALAASFREDYARPPSSPGDVYIVFRERGAGEGAGGRLVGFGALYERDAERRTAELSYQVGERACRGRGLGTEIVQALCAFAFRRARLASVHISVVVENAASVRAARRSGFRCYGLRPQSHVGTHAGRPALFDEFLLICFPQDLERALADGGGSEVTILS